MQPKQILHIFILHVGTILHIPPKDTNRKHGEHNEANSIQGTICGVWHYKVAGLKEACTTGCVIRFLDEGGVEGCFCKTKIAVRT